jgi:hypothetical protein
MSYFVASLLVTSVFTLMFFGPRWLVALEKRQTEEESKQEAAPADPSAV